jgi:hypothetical protein
MTAVPVLEIWPLHMTRAQAETVEEALRQDGYAIDKDGLRDWVLDGIKLRHPDALTKVQRWMQDNPEKMEALKKTGIALGRNVPFFLRAVQAAFRGPRP